MIYYVSSENKNKGDGTKENPFRTIQQAADIARSGDTVEIGGGIYRERVDPQYGGSSEQTRITYCAAEGEKVILTGAEPFGKWESAGNSIWRTVIDNSVFRTVSATYNPFAEEVRGDWYNGRNRTQHTGEVYFDDIILSEADSKEDLTEKMKWFAVAEDSTTEVFANFGDNDPNEHVTEFNARPTCFFASHEGVNYITVRGLEIRRGATQWAPPTVFQMGLIGPHWSKGWIIEDCIIHDSKCNGISLGKCHNDNDNEWSLKNIKDGTQLYIETVFDNLTKGWSKDNIGSHIIRNNEIYNCGQTGICGAMGSAFCLIENNHIHDIDNHGELDGCEMGGIKIHAAIDTVIRRNVIHDCIRGIYLDWEAQGTRVSENLIYNNLDHDLFIEVCHGPTLIDNNVLLSPVAFQNASQGLAFVNNLIKGEHRSWRDLSRFTIYHMPHDTAVKGLSMTYGGDDRWIGNMFIGEKAGTSIYDNYVPYDEATGSGVIDDRNTASEATMPVDIRYNMYLNGAKAYKKEKNAVVSDADIGIEVVNEDGRIFLKSNLTDKELAAFMPVATSDMLGNAFEPDQRFSNADGSDLYMDNRFSGAKRNETTSAGPFTEVFEKLPVSWRA